MKRILILLALSLLMTGCPLGNDEPSITPCGLFPPKEKGESFYFTCYPYQQPTFVITLEQAMTGGFIGLSVADYAEVKKHHDKLHVELDLCD